MRKIKRFVITMLMGLTACTLAIGLSACNTIKKGEREWQESVPESSVEDSSFEDSSFEPVHTHEFGDWKVKTEATCVEEGLEVRTCTGFGCGEQQTQTIPAKGHQELSDAAIEPTCTTEGKTEGSHCSVCSETLVAQEIIPAIGHDVDCAVSAESKLATCMSKAYCGVCESEYGEVLGHTPDIITMEAKYPTCFEGGWGEYEICQLCNYTTKELVSALGHLPVDIPGIAPTCTKEGYGEAKKCERCDEILQEYQVIPALGHDVDCVNENSYPASCTEKAYCGVCGSVYGEALGHDVNCENEQSKAATCTAKAYCGVCASEYGETLAHDVNCENEQSRVATCKTKAYCGVCGNEYGEVLAHETDIVVVGPQEATCEVGGWDSYEKCLLCTYTTKVDIPALGHNVKAIPQVDPTCTEDGCAAGEVCKRCEAVLGGFEVVPMLGHDVNCVNAQSKAATCTDRAYCGVCGNEYGLPLGHDVNCVNGESDPATCISRAYCGVCEKEYGETLKHEIVWMPAKPATCLEDGWDTYKKCTYEECGIDAKVIIPALGHLSKVIEAIDPTCTEVGYTEGAQCERCNILLTNPQVVAPLGHDVNCVNENSYIADCTRRAYCGVCESEYGDAPIYGVHTYITIEAKLPTHEETGWKEYQVCKYCYYSTYTDETALEKVPHEPKYYEAKEPTCTEAGYEGGWVCLVCEDFTVIPALGHDGCRYGQEEPIHPDTIVPSCEEQGYCGICGEYGELPAGHTPRKEATCTTKAVCKECGEEYGEPNGHRYSDSFAYCLMCGAPKVDLYINKEND